MTPLLTVEEVARILCVSKRTIWRLVASGELPPPVKVGKRLRRWRLQDIEDFVSEKPPKKSRR